MRSLRTPVVFAAAVSALSWSALSHAHDKGDVSKGDVSNDKDDSSSQTTQSGGSAGGSTDVGGGMTGSSSSSTNLDTGTSTSTTTTTSSPYGAGQPYQPYQPAAPPATTSTTTTTAGMYNFDNAPPGAERTRQVRPNGPLLVSGGAIFLGSYGASAIAAAASDTPEDDNLYIPVVGPWIDLGTRECAGFACGGREDFNQALLIGSGIAQGVGVALAITSLFVPESKEEVSVGKRKQNHEQVAEANKPKVNVLPISLRSGAGLGAVGTF